MSLLTRTELIVKGANLSNGTLYSTILEYRSRRDRGKSLTTQTTIFLSHKHGETTELGAAIAILANIGVLIYVDWQDDEMPKTTSGETAKKIKNKIRQCDKFILLATDGAIASKWCNWELGHGDAAKYLNDIALFPVTNDNKTWSGNEYMQIYPRIEYNEQVKTYYVIYPDNSSITLYRWLNNVL